MHNTRRNRDQGGRKYSWVKTLPYLRYLLIILVVLGLLFPEYAQAQCAMCRAALESEVDNSQAEGINNGILYLMAIPYILVGGLFIIIYRKIKG